MFAQSFAHTVKKTQALSEQYARRRLFFGQGSLPSTGADEKPSLLGSIVLASSLILFGSNGSAISANSDYFFEKTPGRVALVVDNVDYDHYPAVPSAASDAAKMKETLQQLKFDPILSYHDVTMTDFKLTVVPKFLKVINPGDLVVFYYSGHGFVYGQYNYLVPRDLPEKVAESDLPDKAFSVEGFQETLQGDAPELAMFLLDSCRGLSNIIINDGSKDTTVLKGWYQDNSRPRPHYNTLIGYAAGLGSSAQGSNVAGQLSTFSGALVQFLPEQDLEFDLVFKDVNTLVRTETNDKQQPGLAEWSQDLLYLNPSASKLDDIKALWLQRLKMNDRPAITNFSRQYALSQYGAASRKWLDDHPATQTGEAFALVSPAAVERAWREDNSDRVALLRTDLPIGFPRYLALQPTDIKLTDMQLGLVPSGTKVASICDSTESSSTCGGEKGSKDAGKQEHDLALLAATGVGVTTTDLIAHTDSGATGLKVEKVPSGTRIENLSVANEISKKLSRLFFRVSGKGLVGRIDVKPVSAAPVSGESKTTKEPLELGQSLKEIFVKGQGNALPDTVDTIPIVQAIDALRSAHRSITWIALATKGGTTEKEILMLEGRVYSTEYALTENGIERQRITSVAGVPEIKTDQVRVRIFGY